MPRPRNIIRAGCIPPKTTKQAPYTMTKQIKLSPFARNYKCDVRALDEGTDGVRTYALSVSSELPVERTIFGRHSLEILSHEPSAVDLTRAEGMPLLLEHDHAKQIGVVEQFSLVNGRAEAIVRFSRSAVGADVERDVADGIRRNVSIGYRINEMQFEGVDAGGADIYRATNWMPYEISIVSVPADPTVGVGRAAGDEYTATINGLPTEDDEKDKQDAEGEAVAADAACNQAEEAAEQATGTDGAAEDAAEAAAAAAVAVANAAAAATAATTEPAEATPADATEDTTEATATAEAAPEAAADPMPAEAPADMPADAATDDKEKEAKGQRMAGTANKSEASHQQAAGNGDSAPAGKRSAAVSVVNNNKAAADIVKLAAKYGMAERAADFLQRGLSVSQAASELLALTRTKPTNLPKEANQKMQNVDMKRYSFARALLVAAGDEKGGYEEEVNQALRSALAEKGIQARGFLMPTAGLRAMTATGATGGKELVATEHGDLIQAIYDATVSSKLGVQMLDGLQGNLEFPRELPGLQAHWKGENPGTDAEASELAFGQLTMSPKTLIATTSFSRQLLVQASESVEALVRNRLALEHALKIDQAIFSGMGGTQPVGIYNHEDVSAFAVEGTPSHADITDMVGTLLAANTLTDGVKVVLTPEVAAKLAQTLQNATAGAATIWQGPLTNGTVSGYEAVATNLIGKSHGAGGDEHGFVVGDFSNVIVGNWGTIEIIADPYTKAAQGLIKFTSSQFVDIGVRHGQAFVKATGVKPV